MALKWIEALTGPLEQKKKYKADKARIEGLPEPYGTAARAMHRYLTYCGGIVDGDTLLLMFGDLADLWERAAIDRTPVRDLVGADPVDFAETFAQAYAGRHWIDKERARLTRAIDDAEREGRQ
jgi:DNA-binding ferritin-like protein (Dps family)